MKEKITYISVIAMLIVAMIFMARQCSSNAESLSIANQNIDAMMDRTRKTENLLGKAQYEKKIFMGDVEMLRKLNGDLMKEADAQKGKTRVVIKVVTEVVFDTIRVDNKVDKINDSTFSIALSYKKDYDSLNSVKFNGSIPVTASTENGSISLKSSTTTITDLSMKMKIFTGIKEDNGTYSIFTRTDFPGVKFDLDGAVIDPEKSFVQAKKPFSVMLGTGIGYGITSNGIGLFPSAGLFVGINLFNF